MLCAYAGSGFGSVGEWVSGTTHTHTDGHGHKKEKTQGQAVSESQFKKGRERECVCVAKGEKGCMSLFVCWNG